MAMMDVPTIVLRRSLEASRATYLKELLSTDVARGFLMSSSSSGFTPVKLLLFANTGCRSGYFIGFDFLFYKCFSLSLYG